MSCETLLGEERTENTEKRQASQPDYNTVAIPLPPRGCAAKSQLLALI